VIVVGSIIKRYGVGNVDGVFWIGVGFTFLLLFFIVFIIKKISSKTKEIKDL